MSRLAIAPVLLTCTVACSSTTTTISRNDNADSGTTSTATGGATSNVGGTSAGGVSTSGGTTAAQGGATGGATTAQGGATGGATTAQGGATGGATAAQGGATTAQGGATGGATTAQGGATGGTTAAQGGATGGSSPGGSGGTTTGGAPGTACIAAATKCGGREVETTVLKCGDSQTGYTATAYCSDTNSQCNPTSGTCFKLGIDPTEVTRSQYAAFVTAGGVTQVPGCATFNTSLAPDPACMANATVCSGSACDTQPQVCVDWCDAYAYCDKLGRRLCGRIGGGMNPFDRYADPGSSQWMNACGAGGQYKYGPGDRVESGPQFCNYVGTQLGTTYAVGSHAGCGSPSPTYNTIFDLSGNVAEWEDSCEQPIDPINLVNPTDACRTRGGSFASALAALSCDTVPASALRRDSVSPEVGFRCCAK
jgi:formylglycine-generating enzyme